MPVLKGPLKDDKVFPQTDKIKILSMRPLKNKVLVRLIPDSYHSTILIPTKLNRATRSLIVQTSKEEEHLKKYDQVLHNNRAGMQFSFRHDQDDEKYRIIPTRLIQAVIK